MEEINKFFYKSEEIKSVETLNNLKIILSSIDG